MNRRLLSLGAVVGLLMGIAPTASALDWDVVAGVTRIESTYVPDHLNLRLDTAAGSCAAGSWLFFYGTGSTDADRKDSVKATYAGLLVAMQSGSKVEVYGVNAGCVVQAVHLLNP